MRKITGIKYLILVLLTFVGCLSPIFAQQQNDFEISGIVKDGTGEPVIGATIVVKNTQIGTTSDMDGKFSLATSPNQSRHVYAPSDKVREMYLRNPGDKHYKVAMIDLVDKDGKLILTQINKFRGKVYPEGRYFDRYDCLSLGRPGSFAC